MDQRNDGEVRAEIRATGRIPVCTRREQISTRSNALEAEIQRRRPELQSVPAAAAPAGKMLSRFDPKALAAAIASQPSCQRSELPTNDWFGGDPAVLSGRENVRDVTIYDLLQDINESRHGYCFLRVLHREDRPAFLALVDEKDYVDIFQRRAIKLSIWLVIMKSMKVRANYFVYRRAYEGENKGSTVVSPRLTNYVVPVWHFGRRKEIDREVSGFEYLIKMFRSLTVEEPVTRILLDNNHMETFEFSSQFRLSSWYNLDYVLPNEYFGRLVE